MYCFSRSLNLTAQNFENEIENNALPVLTAFRYLAGYTSVPGQPCLRCAYSKNGSENPGR
jgi:hypothetical protein